VRLRVGLRCLGGLTGEEMDQYTGMPIVCTADLRIRELPVVGLVMKNR